MRNGCHPFQLIKSYIQESTSCGVLWRRDSRWGHGQCLAVESCCSQLMRTILGSCYQSNTMGKVHGIVGDMLHQLPYVRSNEGRRNRYQCKPASSYLGFDSTRPPTHLQTPRQYCNCYYLLFAAVLLADVGEFEVRTFCLFILARTFV